MGLMLVFQFITQVRGGKELLLIIRLVFYKIRAFCIQVYPVQVQYVYCTGCVLQHGYIDALIVVAVYSASTDG